MDIEYLRDFEELAKDLSFRNAAESRRISPSAFSKHISALEDELGLRLFSRGNNGEVSLTHAGKALRQRLNAVVANYDDALELVTDMREGFTSSIRIGYFRDAAKSELFKLFQWYSKNAPKVRFSANTGSIEELATMLLEHKVDAILTLDVNPALREKCVSTKLFEEEFMLITNVKHPLATQGSIYIDQLENEVFNIPNTKAWSELFEKLNAHFGKLDIFSKGITRNDVYAVIDAVELNQGIGIVASHNAPGASKKIVFHPIQKRTEKGEEAIVDLSVKVCCMWLKKTEGNGAMSARLKLLRRALRSIKKEY